MSDFGDDFRFKFLGGRAGPAICFFELTLNNAPALRAGKKNCRTCRGSFFAVSKPNFATRYSLFIFFRDLQFEYTFAPLKSQNLAKIQPNFLQKNAKNSSKFSSISSFFAPILMKIDRKFTIFLEVI